MGQISAYSSSALDRDICWNRNLNLILKIVKCEDVMSEIQNLDYNFLNLNTLIYVHANYIGFCVLEFDLIDLMEEV